MANGTMSSDRLRRHNLIPLLIYTALRRRVKVSYGVAYWRHGTPGAFHKVLPVGDISCLLNEIDGVLRFAALLISSDAVSTTQA